MYQYRNTPEAQVTRAPTSDIDVSECDSSLIKRVRLEACNTGSRQPRSKAVYTRSWDGIGRPSDTVVDDICVQAAADQKSPYT